MEWRLVGRGGLEVSLVMTALRAFLLLSVASGVAGCFDVSTGRTPMLLDNFDDGVLPADPYFDQWRCGKYKADTTTEDCACGYDAEAFRSPPYSMYLDATVEELRSPPEAGAHVYTQGYASEDLSVFREIVFSIRYDEYSSPNPLPSRLYLEFNCSSEDDRLVQPVNDWQGGDWRTHVLELSQFTCPYSKKDPATCLQSCLQNVDNIDFSVNAALQPNGKRSFVLNIDDVYFR